MYKEECDDYCLFWASLNASTDDYWSNSRGSFPSDDAVEVAKLKKSLEDGANAFLARVRFNKPTNHEVVGLRARYRKPPAQKRGSILDPEFRADVLSRLREALVEHWSTDVGPFNTEASEAFLRLLRDTGEFRNYDITSRSASYWNVRDASSGDLVHASGAILIAADVARWRRATEEGGDDSEVVKFKNFVRTISRFQSDFPEWPEWCLWPEWPSVTSVFASHLRALLARKRWRLLLFPCALLSLQKRAVVSANHPGRKRARGEFYI